MVWIRRERAGAAAGKHQCKGYREGDLVEKDSRGRSCHVLNIWGLPGDDWCFMDISHLILIDKCRCFWLKALEIPTKTGLHRQGVGSSNRAE